VAVVVVAATVAVAAEAAAVTVVEAAAVAAAVIAVRSGNRIGAFYKTPRSTPGRFCNPALTARFRLELWQ
jgi:hypothetical protein